jgi:hypothetical protein
MCRIHGHRVCGYMHFEKTNYPPEKDNVVLPFLFPCSYVCPGPYWSPSKNVMHHGPYPECHECNVTPLRKEVHELEM